MNKKKISALLGFAMKSRKLVYGEQNTLNAIKSNKAKIVFIASDISDNTRKRLVDKSNYRNIPINSTFDRYELGRIIGKEFAGCLAVTDKNFFEGIMKYIGGENIGKEESLHNS